MNYRNDNWLISLGKNFALIRESKNYTQEKLAYESGITLSQIARIETGDTNPTACTLIALSQTLKVNPAAFLDTPFEILNQPAKPFPTSN